MFAASVRTNSYGPGFYVPLNPSFVSRQGGLDLPEETNLDYSGDPALGSLTLKAQATVTDTGTVSYKWKHILPESTIEFDCGAVSEFTIKKGTVVTEAEKEFIKAYSNNNYELILNSKNETTEDEKFDYTFGTVVEEQIEEVKYTDINEFDRYYNSTGTSELTSAQIKDAKENEQSVYEKITTFTLPKDPDKEASEQPVTGWYFVVATNTIANKKSSDPTSSTKTNLISPKDVVIGNRNSIESVTLKDGKALLNTELKSGDPGEKYIVSVKTTEDGVLETHDTEMGTYSLSLKGTPTEVDKLELVKDSKGNYNIEPKDNTTKLEPGWYQATITARRNREDKSNDTKIWRVLNPVSVPQIVDENSNHEKYDENEDPQGTVVNESGKTITLRVKVNGGQSLSGYFGDTNDKKSLLSDGYYCRWSKGSLDTGFVGLDTEYSDSIKIDNPQNELVCYQCELVNTLNGETAISSCRFYVV